MVQVGTTDEYECDPQLFVIVFTFVAFVSVSGKVSETAPTP